MPCHYLSRGRFDKMLLVHVISSPCDKAAYQNDVCSETLPEPRPVQFSPIDLQERKDEKYFRANSRSERKREIVSAHPPHTSSPPRSIKTAHHQTMRPPCLALIACLVAAATTIPTQASPIDGNGQHAFVAASSQSTKITNQIEVLKRT
jgi:hypothetical protein